MVFPEDSKEDCRGIEGYEVDPDDLVFNKCPSEPTARTGVPVVPLMAYRDSSWNWS